ncbi:MAG TPA: Stp1/IreP family PP2C-type Ser/Thr phosphatase [Mycobacteriales bacterium]|jgi:protein phosphatase|nr:Stp1/IreP family PP2C-type Ser/Thr phosphatase [Mycobacteriales bacterium]
MTLSWRYAAASDVGLLRDGNEDAAFAGRRLLAVADGMGGHAAGEVASAAVIAALEQLDELGVDAGDPREALQDAVREANANLRDMVAADAELHGMGTTVTAVLTDGDAAWLAHVGDSRAYLLREGELRQLTRDHTFVQQLVDEGRIRREDVSTHPQRNVIMRALDGREGLELDLERLEVRPGDRLLLCSDGLSGVVTDDSLAAVLGDSSPEEAVQRLVDLALRGGGPDNITCIVADAVDAPGAGGPVEAGAVVAGAAEDSGPHTRVAPSARDGASPATKAAALAKRPAKRPAAPPPEADAADPRARARGLRRRRAFLVALLTIGLLAIGTTTGYAWTQRQYYVGVADGQVAIYRGVDTSVAGVRLSHVAERLPLAVADLPDFERKRLADGIHAAGLPAARQIVDRLREALPPCPEPTPTPSAVPTTAPARPKPTVGPRPPSPRPATTPPATPLGTARPTPTATPSPVPGPCAIAGTTP